MVVDGVNVELFGELMQELRKKAIDRLLQRRQAIQEEYDRMVAEPASYGITGSVSATNRNLKDLREELVAIDEKLNSLVAGGGAIPGMSVKWPDYRYSPFGGLQ